jgi:hypothetical protein
MAHNRDDVLRWRGETLYDNELDKVGTHHRRVWRAGLAARPGRSPGAAARRHPDAKRLTLVGGRSRRR